MRRRTACLAPAAAILAAPSAALAAPRRPRGWNLGAPRRLRLRHAANDAAFSGPWHNGLAPDPAAMRELSQVLADTRTGAIRPFDPRVIDILWELGERERIADFTVLSGYRTPGTNAIVEGAPDSQHMRAAALDLLIPAPRLAAFAGAALALARGGVGLYASRGFVHIDSGPVRRWADAPPADGGRRAAPPDRLAPMAEAWAATRRGR
jgi:uncharacterized protein YcbK (DUF882 family)